MQAVKDGLPILAAVILASSGSVLAQTGGKNDGLPTVVGSHRDEASEAQLVAEVAAAEKEAKDTVRLARAVDRLAYFHALRGRFAEAQSEFRRSLTIREAALGPDLLDVARSLHNLATVSAARHVNDDSAESLYRRALTIREKAANVKPSELARTLDGLAAFYVKRGRWKVAEPLRWQALRVREKAARIGPDHAFKRGFVVSIDYPEPKAIESMLLVGRLLEPNKGIPLDERIELAETFSHVAEFHRCHRDLSGAAALYERALELRAHAETADDLGLAQDLDGLAEIRDLQKDRSKGEQLQRRALAAWERALGPAEFIVADRTQRLGDKLMARGRHVEAVSVLKLALASFERTSSIEGVDPAVIRDECAKRLVVAERGSHIVAPQRATKEDVAYLRQFTGDFEPPKDPELLIASALLPKSAPPLLLAPELCDVESLNLGGSEIDDAGMIHLRGLTRLKELNLDRTGVGDDGLAHLQAVSGLRVLSLWETRVTDAGMSQISSFPILERLNICFNRVTDRGLAEIGKLEFLQSLNASCEAVTDNGLTHIRRLTRMRDLTLIGTKVTGPGLVCLEGMKELRELDLASSPINDAGLVHLTGLLKLQELNLDNTQVGDAGIVHLRGLAGLTKIDLVSTHVTDAGLVHLRGLANLQELSLLGTQVKGPGLTQLRGLPRLTKLSLGGAIDDTALAPLEDIPTLKEFYIGGNPPPVSQAALKRLRQALPEVAVRFERDRPT